MITAEDQSILSTKVDKNYLFSKEATQLIINSYDDLIIKNDFLNYLIENLTEYYILSDFTYINLFLFPQEPSSITDDIIFKVVNNKNSMLFDYYFKQLFAKDDGTHFVQQILKVVALNANLKPKDIRAYYNNYLHTYLHSLPLEEIETFYEGAKKSFEVLPEAYFTIDLYKNFIIPAFQNKLKEKNVETKVQLKELCDFINYHVELRYNRTSRILLTANNLIDAHSSFFTYDSDIMYDVQEYLEKIMIKESLLDYNLIYFCSYFDGKIDFNKSLNMLINIMEGTHTISISKTKFQQIQGRTIEESLTFLQWALEFHHKDTINRKFDHTMKNFICYNWNLFTHDNKTFLNMKSMLANYGNLEDILLLIKKEKMNSFQRWYGKNGSFILTCVITLSIFLGLCFFGVHLISNLLVPINDQLTLVTIILAEVIVAALLVVMMMVERE